MKANHLKAVAPIEYETIPAPPVEPGISFIDSDLLERSLTFSMKFDVVPEFDNLGNLVNADVFYAPPTGKELRNWNAKALEYDNPSLTQQVMFIREMKLMDELASLLGGKTGVLETSSEAVDKGKRVRETIVKIGSKKQGTVYGANGRMLLDLIDDLENQNVKICAEIHYVPYVVRPMGADYLRHELVGMLRMPEASRFEKWLHSSDEQRATMHLNKPAKAYFRLKDQGQCAENIAKVTQGDIRWSGRAKIELKSLTRGKYAGQQRFDYYVDGVRVGGTHPEHRVNEELLFRVVEAGIDSIPVRTAFGLGSNSAIRLIAEVDLDDFGHLGGLDVPKADDD